MPKKAPATDFEARKNKDSTEDYSVVFLCHAQLYAVGRKYLDLNLLQLAIHRLHATLKVIELYSSRLQDITLLVKYAFGNVHRDEDICDMLSLYCACIVDILDNEEGKR